MDIDGPAWRLTIFPTIGSTSDYLIERAEAGAAEGEAVLARRQTRGRGSRGRVWTAPEGNLNLSVLFRPNAPVNCAHWALLAAVAFHETLQAYAPDASLQLKWPNDVLLDGRKLAGLLIDTALDGQGACRWLVIGLGANLCHTPPNLDRPVASLADLGITPAPEVVAEKLLDALFHWRQASPQDVQAAWLARAHPVGTELLITGENARGRFAGLDKDGALLLQMPQGNLRRFHSGDLVFAPISQS